MQCTKRAAEISKIITTDELLKHYLLVAKERQGNNHTIEISN